MKIHLLALYVIATSVIHADSMSTNDAISFLKETGPQEGGIMRVITLPRDKIDLYNRQVAAIAVISNDNSASCVDTLIPYLNYAANAAAKISGGIGGMGGENDVVRDWPAFGAILHMKNSGAQLQRYIKDKQNPLNYRLAAFLVLRYVDKTEFQELVHALDNEVSDKSPAVKDYLKNIEDGSEHFWGVPDLQ